MRFAALFSVAFCAVIATASDANAEQLAIKTYNVEAGLAANRIKRITQDSHGFLWFCTADGLSRFDGSQFVNYRFEDGLPAASINDVLEASDGVYWVATNSVGVVLFDLAGTPPDRADLRSRFTRYPISSEGVTNRVNILHRDRTNTLWAGTDGGLFQLAPGERTFRPVPLGVPSQPDIQVQVWSLVEDSAGQLWIGTRFGVIRRAPDGRLSHYQIHPSAGDDNVAALVREPGGRLWIGHRSGLFTFVPTPDGDETGTHGSHRLPSDARRFTTADGLDNDHVVALHRSHDGTIWIRTFGAGLTRFDGTSLRTYNVGQRAGEDVVSLTEDREGNLWAGTRTAGALKVITRPWTNYNQADGLGEAVNGVLENDAGDLHVTSSAWRVSRFDGKTFSTITLPLPRTVREETWRGTTGVLQDHAGDWWAGTREGLYRFSGVGAFDRLAHAQSSAVYTVKDGLASDDIGRLFEDSSGDIWIGSWPPVREVLVRWDRATSMFHRYGIRDGLRSFTSAQAFASDAAGNVWVGFREGGLARYRQGQFLLLGAADGLPEHAINGLYLDPKYRLWIAFSGGGLGRIDAPDAERPHMIRYTTADGLTTDLTLNITGDRAGRVYVAGARGIDRFDPDTRKVTHYSTADGVTGGEFLAARRDRSGALWFATTTGLSRLTPEPNESRSPPPILISGVRVAGIVHPVSALGQASMPSLELDSRQNNVQIDFFSLGFQSGEAIRYEYRLQGGAGEWSPPGPQRSVNYANLSPGSYTFAIRAVSVDDTRSVSPATVSFTILPPVWRRSWFLGLATAAIAAAAGLFARARHERIRSLRESENRFRTLAETASDAIITIDEESRIVLVNQATQKIFGYTREELVGADLTLLMPMALRGRHRDGLDRYTRTRQRHVSWDGMELAGRHKDGHEIPLEISFGEFVRNDRIYFTGIVRDVTERKRTEEALRRSREERFAELERVRKRIATDLHDDIGSSLTRISLLSEVAKQQVGGAHEELREPLTSIAGLSRQLVDSMSDIVWAINPERDHISDLSRRMRHFASDLCTARQITLRFETPPPERDVVVGANIRRELFLLFKEAVTNMARHSACTEANLLFREDQDGLALRIADNGRGFHVQSVTDGHGLLSMQRRTEALGGHFEIISAPGCGTVLRFTIPTREQAGVETGKGHGGPEPYITMR